jgi:DNA-binding transcriptional MerR regulator
MDEKMETMSSELTEQSEKLREELVELEKQFNIKKEQFIKIQGALEAIQLMSQDTKS